MPTTYLARSKPYGPTLKADQRICTRCGIQFTLSQPKRDCHVTECIDCRPPKKRTRAA